MDIQKFKAYSKELGVSEPQTLQDLVSHQTDFGEYDVYLQYLGYNDFNKEEVYEGDVLELKITEELMDHNKNMFFNSNIGKYIEKEGNITSVILLNRANKRCMSMNYEVYFCVNGKIERFEDDNSLKSSCIGEDSNFPQYLCSKGATIIGNIIMDENILENM